MRYRRRFRRCSLVMLALTPAACGDDSTGPEPATDIAVAVLELDGPAISQEVGGEPRIRCDVTFRATATGTGRANWQDATIRFFVGPDRSRPVDSIFIPATEIHAAWVDTGMDAGTTDESRWYFESGAPFAISADFRYRPSSSGTTVKTANVSFLCGPEVPASSTPPAIAELTLTAPVDGLEPSDTLLVSYRVTSGVGVWATAVELTGPCEAFVEFLENLQTNVVRTVPIQIPPGCDLGAPLTVTVHASDAGLRLVSRGVVGPSISDHTPPRVSVTVLNVFGTTTPIRFAGDSIDLGVTAFDNNGLRAIVYDLLPSGRRDSLVVTSNFNGRFRVPVPLDVTGPVQVRLFARDVVGLTSAEVTTPAGALQVYPTIGRPTLQATVSGGVSGLVIDADRAAIYIVPWFRPHITVLSAASLQATRTIDLPYNPTSLDFTRGGDSLLVTGGAGLTVIDLGTSTPEVTQVPLTLNSSLGQRSERVVVMANGKAFVALGGTSSQAFQLLEVNLATGEQRIRADAADGNGIAGASTIQRSPDRMAFVYNGGPSHFRRYDLVTDQFTLGGNATPYGVKLSQDRGGQHSALSLDIYDVSLAFVRRVESIFGAAAVSVPSTLSADGEYLYYAAAPGIMRSRVSDGLLVDRTLNPILGEIVRIASDDSFIVTARGTDTGMLSLIRLR